LQNITAAFNPNRLDFRGGLFYKNVDQTISNNTNTDVTWQATVFDTDGFLFSATELIIPAGIAKVRVAAQIQWVATNISWHSHWLEVNGSRWLPGLYDFGGFSVSQHVSGPIPVKAGDIIKVRVWQGEGAARDIKSEATAGAGVRPTWVSIEALD
jgi:hypothetical protein